MYSPIITYQIYDLNSTIFLCLIREILQAEFQRQIALGNDFLPIDVKTDEYLLSPIADKEINPAFCSVIKAKSTNAENQFHGQENINNSYIIGILANGLENLRKISDAIYIILNDMDIKNYIFNSKNCEGVKLISDDGTYRVVNMSTEFEVEKTINDKNIVNQNDSLERGYPR